MGPQCVRIHRGDPVAFDFPYLFQYGSRPPRDRDVLGSVSCFSIGKNGIVAGEVKTYSHDAQQLIRLGKKGPKMTLGIYIHQQRRMDSDGRRW
jgi:hypothetical protein